MLLVLELPQVYHIFVKYGCLFYFFCIRYMQDIRIRVKPTTLGLFISGLNFQPSLFIISWLTKGIPVNGLSRIRQPIVYNKAQHMLGLSESVVVLSCRVATCASTQEYKIQAYISRDSSGHTPQTHDDSIISSFSDPLKLTEVSQTLNEANSMSLCYKMLAQKEFPSMPNSSRL